jgi:DNA-directed RNA polymerase subunit RPC12/RpoP
MKDPNRKICTQEITWYRCENCDARLIESVDAQCNICKTEAPRLAKKDRIKCPLCHSQFLRGDIEDDPFMAELMALDFDEYKPNKKEKGDK